MYAPEVFDVDDDGNVAFVEEPDDSQTEAVLNAEMCCPEQAIRIER